MQANRIFYLLALLSFFPALFYFYVGEEGLFTIYSMEMWQHQNFLSVMSYGGSGGRPPLYNWLMIPVTRLIGWDNVLVAARLVTVVATFCSSLILAWLAQQLWRDKEISIWAALLYITTADVLIYRGWLAYADPLFAAFVLLALAWLWVSCLRHSHYFLAAALIAAFAAFLTKALTIYIFFGVTWVVLVRDKQYREFLTERRLWLIYLLGMSLPVLWLALNSQSSGQGQEMLHDILAKISFISARDYLVQVIIFPLEMSVRLMPVSFILCYLLLRKGGIIGSPALSSALLIALLNFLPYWFAPQSSVRYVLPIYPFLALAAAYLVVKSEWLVSARRWVAGMVALGFVMKGILFPYYQSHYRGENYFDKAQDILKHYGNLPLYSMDSTAVGSSVTAYIDSINFAHPALGYPSMNFSNGIVLASSPDVVSGQIIKSYQLGGNTLYLICRGEACAAN